MFHRRRAASNPPTRAPSNPNSAATLAASQAFLKGRTSNASLSNAAAAAALRTHATSPTPVGDIQTKRMVRRGSTSSQGSTGSNQAPGLRRQSSSGSMSERTFRASSPNRGSPVVEADPNAPPVPAIPRDIPSPVAHQRASSLEPPFRGASPRRGGGRGVSVDRGMPAAGRGHARAGSSLAQVVEVDRENSTRSNVNFSRPMSTTASPSPSPIAARSGQSGWFASPVTANKTFRDDSATRPKTADGAGIRNAFAEQSIRNVPAMPVHKNKIQSAGGFEGARIAAGHMGVRTRGASVDEHSRPSTSSGVQAVDPKSSSAVYDPSTRRFIQKQTQPEYQQPVHRTVERPQSPPIQRPQSPPVQRPQSPSVQWPQSPPTQQTPSAGFQTQMGALLASRNSEDYGEDDQRQSVPDANTSRRLDPSTSNLDAVSNAPSPTSNQESRHSQPMQPRAQTPTNTLSAGNNGSIRGDRPQSLSPGRSPGRSAHFATSSVELPNGVKHNPPPRSISPAKSALKHSPSNSRTHSPAVFAGRKAPSETSDNMSDDGSRSTTARRKKTVRVSFDDGPVIAGTSAYAETSPTSPKGIETSKWSSRSPTSPDGDVDDVMGPRPALPSFGSIRDRSRQRDDEDMAEKVTETIPSSMSTSASTIAEPLDSSSDHALAGILTNNMKNRNAAEPSSQGLSRKSNSLEPIPPEVTSVEGSGYVSDSDQSVLTQDEEGNSSYRATPATSVSSAQPSKATLRFADESTRQDVHAPAIAVIPATPGPEEQPEPKYIMPGGFPDQYEETTTARRVDPESMEQKSAVPQPTPVKRSEPSSSAIQNVRQPSSRELMNQRLDQEEQLPVVEEHSDSGNESIYSDAEENFSEDEGGFASIDAVVESPITKPAPGLALTTPPDSPAQLSSLNDTQARQDTSSTQEESDWKAARDHWSGLTLAQRQAMEQEATPEVPKALSADVPILQPAKAKKRNTVASSAPQAAPNTQTNRQPQAPAHTRAQPRKSALKHSMRQEQESTAAEPHIRKTMRTGNASQQGFASSASDMHMKKSMRGGDTIRSGMRNDPGLAASRYSAPTETREPRGALQKRNLPAAVAPAKTRPQSASGPLATAVKAPQKPPMGRTFSADDSDASESSFRRERRKPKGSNGDRYSMRRSMRGGPAAPSAPSASAPMMRPQSAQVKPLSQPSTMRTSMRPTSPTPAQAGIKSSRFSIRSLSPAGGGILGKSRRSGSIDATASVPAPTMRSQPEKSAPKLGGFGKKPKVKPTASSKPASRFTSRFADSSDEDDDRPTRFKSRFADSDEDSDDGYTLPAGLAPVRGIPRQPGDEDRDSTDLSDEDSGDERPSNKDIEKGGLQSRTNAQQEISFANNSLRKSKHGDDGPNGSPAPKKDKGKRGFFGLGKKKQSATQTGDISAAAPLPIPNPPPHTRSPPQPETPTKQRPLTPIGEDDGTKDIEAASPATPISPGSIRSPKLQRRNTPQWGRSTSDSWPLSPPPKIGEEARPASSDGVFARPPSLRPTLSKRHSSAVTTGSARMAIDPKSGKEVVVGRTGRKKRFPMLRKAFGLND